MMKKYDLNKGEAIKKLAKKLNIDELIIKPKVTTKYLYTDEQEKQLFGILKYRPKAFSADRKMDGAGLLKNQVSVSWPSLQSWVVLF